MNTHPASDKSSTQIVTGLRWWNERLLSFTTTKPPDYSFVAGQYARLGLREGDDTVWRAYSMTSAPDHARLEFYGIVVPNGLFTSRLKMLAPGAAILIENQVYGFMTPDRFADGDDLWMLSTGTGVGPFISMLRDPYIWHKFRRLVLVHCVRHADEFSYHRTLSEMQEHPPFAGAGARFTLIESTTRDAATAARTGRLQGRITTLLDNGMLEQEAGLPLTVESSRVMLCGNPDMIEETRRILHHRGMRPCRRVLPGQFVTENYW